MSCYAEISRATDGISLFKDFLKSNNYRIKRNYQKLKLTNPNNIMRFISNL